RCTCNFFFFQAEDGIRDGHVTGVQTCALPISSYDSEADVLYLHFKKPNHADNSEMTEDEIIVRYENKEVIGMTILNASQRLKKRSEERRVGKECRIRWWS